MTALADVTRSVHGVFCGQAHSCSAAADAHAALFRRLADEVITAPSYQRAVEVVHAVQCPDANPAQLASRGHLECLSAIAASHSMRGWWARAGRADPFPAAAS